MHVNTFFPPRGFPESALKLLELELVLGLRWSEDRTPPGSWSLRNSCSSEKAALEFHWEKVDLPRTTGGERSRETDIQTDRHTERQGTSKYEE